jgi:hypothetical protein
VQQVLPPSRHPPGVPMPETLEYSRSHQMIAAGIRLRDAWSKPAFDVVELHEAALDLIRTTDTADLHTALAVLRDVEYAPPPSA